MISSFMIFVIYSFNFDQCENVSSLLVRALWSPSFPRSRCPPEAGHSRLNDGTTGVGHHGDLNVSLTAGRMGVACALSLALPLILRVSFVFLFKIKPAF